MRELLFMPGQPYCRMLGEDDRWDLVVLMRALAHDSQYHGQKRVAGGEVQVDLGDLWMDEEAGSLSLKGGLGRFGMEPVASGERRTAMSRGVVDAERRNNEPVSQSKPFRVAAATLRLLRLPACGCMHIYFSQEHEMQTVSRLPNRHSPELSSSANPTNNIVVCITSSALPAFQHAL